MPALDTEEVLSASCHGYGQSDAYRVNVGAPRCEYASGFDWFQLFFHSLLFVPGLLSQRAEFVDKTPHEKVRFLRAFVQKPETNEINPG
jgi:hypothetical protein